MVNPDWKDEKSVVHPQSDSTKPPECHKCEAGAISQDIISLEIQWWVLMHSYTFRSSVAFSAVMSLKVVLSYVSEDPCLLQICSWKWLVACVGVLWAPIIHLVSVPVQVKLIPGMIRC